MAIYRLASYFDGVAEFSYYGALPFGMNATLMVVSGPKVGDNFSIALPYECINEIDFVRVIPGGDPQPLSSNNDKETKDTASLPCESDTGFCPVSDSSATATIEPAAGTTEENGESVSEAKRELDRAIWRKRANLI